MTDGRTEFGLRGSPAHASGLVLPSPVRPGDRVGIAGLSGAADPEALARGLDRLQELGFEPVLSTNLAHSDGRGCNDDLVYFAGSDLERLAGFHELLRDDSIGAILFARGGHGLLRLLAELDWQLLARRPRFLVGYSDLTPLLNLVVQRLGWVSLHGPMVASDLGRDDFSDEEAESLVSALAGEFQPLGLEPIDAALAGIDGETIEAPTGIVGGCLSLLTSTLGTEHACLPEQRMLFLEDVLEPDYRLDRMLTQLELSGKILGIGALLLGHFHGCCPQAGPEAQDISNHDAPAFAPSNEWLKTVLRLSRRHGWPVFRGLACGHGKPNLTLPFGLPARIDLQAQQLLFD